MNTISLFFMRHNRRTPMPPTPERPIRYYDLTIVLEGSLAYRIDGTPITLEAGDALLISRDMLRARDATSDKIDYISFNFHAETPPPLPLVMRGVVQNEAKLMIAACDEVYKCHPLGYEEIATPLLLAILRAFQENLKEATVTPLSAKIVQYLHKNLARRITLADIGRMTFFSPVYCDTVFKKDMGVSIIDYLLSRRIAEAKKLLIEGTFSLSEIAKQTGFTDSNYFTRVFKKRTGYTPTEYKKIYCTV